MATVSKEFADEIIAGNGFCKDSPEDGSPDNPPVVKIVEYTNFAGALAYGVVFEHETNQGRYEIETEYVRSPKVIWTRKR